MEEEREYLGIKDYQKEFSKIAEGFEVVDQNMKALALDYKHYINPSFGESDIYEIRDSLSYRLRANKLHIEIIFNFLHSLDNELTKIYFDSIKKGESDISAQAFLMRREYELSSLFDSIIFHTISAFDYLGNLIGFILLNKNKLKWTSLAKSSRDKNNLIGKNNIGNLIDRKDREFVGRLYDHRSYLIHIRNEYKSKGFTVNFSNQTVESRISSSKTFINNFSSLRKISKTQELSFSYVLIWLLNESIDSIIDIQYGLKEFMENNRKVKIPLMFRKGPNNEMLPLSTSYWKKRN